MEIKCRCGNTFETFGKIDFTKDIVFIEDEYICPFCEENYTMLFAVEGINDSIADTDESSAGYVWTSENCDPTLTGEQAAEIAERQCLTDCGRYDDD